MDKHTGIGFVCVLALVGVAMAAEPERDHDIVVEDYFTIGAVVPDEQRIAMLTSPDEELIHGEGWSRMDVYDVATETVAPVTPDGWREDHPSPYGWLDDMAWSDDSRALAMSISYDGYPTRVYLAE